MNKKIFSTLLLVVFFSYLGCGSSDSPNATTVSNNPDGNTAVVWSSIFLTGIRLSSGTLTPVFSKDVTTYTAQVSNATASITITPIAEDNKAQITVAGQSLRSEQVSDQISLVAAVPKTVEIEVTSSTGNDHEIYTVTITREGSSDANLSDLDITGAAIGDFGTSTLIYSAIVPMTTQLISIKPTLEDMTATVKVNGSPINSGDTVVIDIATGYNIINVLITAQSGGQKTYSVVITRGNSDADITSLGAVDELNNAIAVSPAFDKAVTTYVIQLDPSVNSLRIAAGSSDPYATIKINGSVTASGFQSNGINVNSGVNTITVQIISSDNSTQKIYTIFAVKP